jgi:2,4-dienoyl-CoA reductase-like NADH-dependent reductase (Old Yellow Enzyme family)
MVGGEWLRVQWLRWVGRTPPDLFASYERVGLRLPHRVEMAPLTRNRARATIPGDLNAAYYAQRASAAVLVTEGTHRCFLANPDLPRRLRQGAPLTERDRETFYARGAAGYTDYPALDGVLA